MARVSELKRLVTEDFDSDEQKFAQKLAFTLNPALEQFFIALNGNIDFDNLSQDIKTFEVDLSSGSVPRSAVQVSTKLNRIQGASIINVINLTGNEFPTAAPFMSFSSEGGIFNVNNVSGLPTGNRYQITAIIY